MTISLIICAYFGINNTSKLLTFLSRVEIVPFRLHLYTLTLWFNFDTTLGYYYILGM